MERFPGTGACAQFHKLPDNLITVSPWTSPELVAAATAELPERYVIDGEIVIATDHGLDFEALQQRIHPADSRVRMLADQTPASFIAFCVRAVNDQSAADDGFPPTTDNNEAMKLPVMPPVPPMLAKSVPAIPPGASYEPKWDGFRSICFRDHDHLELGSRNERPLTRYFPELIEAMTTELPERCVIDGEIVIATRSRVGLRGAATTHPPGRLASADARRTDSCVLHSVRPDRLG